MASETMEHERIYFDNNSTTHCTPLVKKAVFKYLCASNPSNIHHKEGREASKVVETSRSIFAGRLQVSNEEIFFTSGGTESNNTLVRQLANIGARNGRKHIVVSSIEHKCMLESCRRLVRSGFDVDEVAPRSDGRIHSRDLLDVMRRDTAFVSVMYVNNETGVRNYVKELATIAHKFGAYMISDCAQAMGKLHVKPRELGLDALSCSMHKFHGPKGVGMMYMRSELVELAKPLMVGGPQEMSLRAGTENVAGIVGSAVALQHTYDRGDESRKRRNRKLRDVSNTLIAQVARHRDLKLFVIGNGESGEPGNPTDRMPHVVLLGFDLSGLCNAKLLKYLDEHGVCASIGSACNTSCDKASHVIRAMHIPENVVKSTIRFSISDLNTVDEARRVATILVNAVLDQI